MPGQFRVDRARREHHRNDHAGDPARTHLRRLPDRSLVRADRYDAALAAYEAERAAARERGHEEARPASS